MSKIKEPDLKIGEWGITRVPMNLIVTRWSVSAEGNGAWRNPSYHGTLRACLQYIRREMEADAVGEAATLDELLERIDAVHAFVRDAVIGGDRV